MEAFINELGQWILSVVLYVPQAIWQMMTDSLASVIISIFAICTACNLSTLSLTLTGLGAAVPGMVWLLAKFKFASGLASTACAYLIRFTIRRLPFIG